MPSGRYTDTVRVTFNGLFAGRKTVNMKTLLCALRNNVNYDGHYNN